MFKFLTYLNDKKPEVIQVPIEVEMELPRAKIELTFVGKGDEVVVYTEFYTPHVGYVTRQFASEANDILSEFMINFTSIREGYLLKNNQLALTSDYFTLAKAQVKDIRQVREKVVVYEDKVVQKN